jgi:hypothetical protein
MAVGIAARLFKNSRRQDISLLNQNIACFSPCGCPHEPLVSYRINRQLSGWSIPPLMIRAFGAHCQEPTFGWNRLLPRRGVPSTCRRERWKKFRWLPENRERWQHRQKGRSWREAPKN